MKFRILTKFEPANAESNILMRVSGRRRTEVSEIVWRVRIAGIKSIWLDDGHTLDCSSEGTLWVAVDNWAQENVHDGVEPPVHGDLRWVDGATNEQFRIVVNTSQSFFDHVCSRAERGLWPTAILEFTGTDEFSYFGPNGDVKWKNIGTRPPTIEEFTFRYRIHD